MDTIAHQGSARTAPRVCEHCRPHQRQRMPEARAGAAPNSSFRVAASLGQPRPTGLVGRRERWALVLSTWDGNARRRRPVGRRS
eukprot:scaffold24649_cov60-Phaeocystis_antarctica.AAC.2